MDRSKPKRKAWQIVLEVTLSVAFFAACMLLWLRFRPTVLKAVFSDALPTEQPSEPTKMPSPDAMPIAYAAYEDERILVAAGTPIPTPVPTPTPSPEPTPVPTKNPKNGDTLYEGDRAPIVIDVAIRSFETGFRSRARAIPTRLNGCTRRTRFRTRSFAGLPARRFRL